MNINFSCPINTTGYGVASWNILKNLYKIEPDIAYFPIGQPYAKNKEDYDLITKLYNNSHSFKAEAPFVKIWHQFDLANHVGKGHYYAMSFFELDTFNTTELSHLKVPDTIFVTSKWAKNIIRNNNIETPVQIIPLGVDSSVFDPNQYASFSNNKYVFLNIGKWEVRKGHDILLELFKKAFPNQQDVELYLLASENTNSYSSAEELQKWKNMYNTDSRVRLLPSANSHYEIAQIMHYSDCGIFPSRAEGWNLELIEMMSMNKPVITTNYSAHTEFCNSDNSYLVDIEHTEKAHDGKAFNGQGNWAKIEDKQKDEIIDHMRYVYKNQIRTNPNGIETAKKFSWTNSAKVLFGCINK
jgi:glycosyltransferase involved in cell wall biosynthesis